MSKYRVKRVQASKSKQKKPWRNLGQSLGMYRYGQRAIALVWQTDWRLTVALGLLTLVAGLLPAAIAYVGKLIVDAVVVAAQSGLAADDGPGVANPGGRIATSGDRLRRQTDC
jgi:hypothetical protein